jgi:hypothetical protein
MAAIGLIIKIIGVVLFLAGWWPVLREIFAESRAIGYLSFLVPIVPLLWSAMHWDDLKRECMLQLIGMGLVASGILFFPVPGAG